jgi:hypothetical protein
MRLCVPAYFDPHAHHGEWRRLCEGAPGVGRIVANPANGPGSERLRGYVWAMELAHLHGIEVCGYLSTAYASRPLEDITSDIERWYALYPIDGIFVDEVSSTARDLEYYTKVSTLVVERDPDRHRVIFNPGAPAARGHMDLCNVLLNWESAWSAYDVGYPRNAEWLTRYPPDSFWHIAYNCPDIDSMRRAIALAGSRHAGWVYVTNRAGANPYGSLPPPEYWRDELRSLTSSAT